MRGRLTVAIGILASLAVSVLPAAAQTTAAPAPKVTINGLIDNVTVWGGNAFDLNFSARKDSLWGSRTRGVFTLTGELGKAKAVLALELDYGWGQVSGSESVASIGGGATSINSSAGGIGAPQRSFQSGGFDLNNDTQGGIEVKNLYVEFPVPLIPLPTVTRLGGQPFQTTYKPSVMATGDYGGVWFSTTIAPFLKYNFTFAQAEEDDVGFRANNNFFRGDDILIVQSVDIQPFKGVSIRPLWAWYHIYGNSFSESRCRLACSGMPFNGVMAAQSQFLGATAPATLGNYRQNSQEDRHYLGIDARMTFGPFYLDPTFIYELSNVDVYRSGGHPGGTPTTAALCTTLAAGLTQGCGQRVHQTTNSFLVDIRTGYRIGPVLLEGLVIWTPGDDAQHDSFRDTKVYHAVTTDGGYGLGWQEILSPGIDYFSGNGISMGFNTGLGRYGRRTIGAKVTYSMTPAFDVNFKVSANWTDTKVDIDAPAAAPVFGSFSVAPCGTPGGNVTSSSLQFGPGAGPLGQLAGSPGPAGSNLRNAYNACLASPFGDKRFIGVELGPGITYRFAPGLSFDAVYSHLFTGAALDSSYFDSSGVYRNRVSAKDADLFAARVRLQF